jgi:two-component system NtrC family sensor kinase
LLEDWPAQGDLRQAGKVRELLRSMNSLTKFSGMAAERMIKIVTGLRTFARLDRAAEDEVDIHDGLESTLTLIHNQLKDRVTVHKDYGDVPPIRCHPSRLNQVYMNLLVNASQAIAGKGEIQLKTFATENDVVVEITDTGEGIPAENLGRVFDPGFTTKGVKVGTGLGLSIVQRILDEHDGKIEVESKVGEGSTFRVFLPLRPVSRPRS